MPDFLSDTLLPIAISRASTLADAATSSALSSISTTVHSAFAFISPSVHRFSLSVVSLSLFSYLPGLLLTHGASTLSRFPRSLAATSALNRQAGRVSSAGVNPLVVAGLGAAMLGTFRIGEHLAERLFKTYGGDAGDEKDKVKERK